MQSKSLKQIGQLYNTSVSAWAQPYTNYAVRTTNCIRI